MQNTARSSEVLAIKELGQTAFLRFFYWEILSHTQRMGGEK